MTRKKAERLLSITFLEGRTLNSSGSGRGNGGKRKEKKGRFWLHLF